MKIYGVEMIPTSLVSCFINGEEMRILELGMQGFSFRSPNQMERITTIQLNYLIFRESRYELLLLPSFELMEERKETFYYIYTIKIDDQKYRELTSYIIRDYSEYIELKLSGDDVYLSNEKVGYPLNESYYKDFDEQKYLMFSHTNWSEDGTNLLNQFELAISIDQPKRYEQYLEMEWENFVASYLKENYLNLHTIAKKECDENLYWQ